VSPGLLRPLGVVFGQGGAVHQGQSRPLERRGHPLGDLDSLPFRGVWLHTFVYQRYTGGNVTGPAVKTSTPDLPPCGAGCAVGGNRVWAEYLGRRASALATLLRIRALFPSVGSGSESDGSARSLRP